MSDLDRIRKDLMEGCAMGYEWVAGVPRSDLDRFEAAVRDDERKKALADLGRTLARSTIAPGASEALRAATARAERAETQARGHEVGLMHAERMGVEVPIYPDIAAWVNVILVADLIDEEIEGRKKDASDGAVAILTIVGRMLRRALNTCRDCGSPEGYHYPDCAALSATEEGQG